MRKLVPILGCVLASMESAAQTDEPWQPFVLSRVAPTLEPAQVAVEVGGGYNGLPQGKTARLDDAYQGSSWLNGSVGLFKGVELSGTVGVSQVPARGWGLADGRAESDSSCSSAPSGFR